MLLIWKVGIQSNKLWRNVYRLHHTSRRGVGKFRLFLKNIFIGTTSDICFVTV